MKSLKITLFIAFFLTSFSSFSQKRMLQLIRLDNLDTINISENSKISIDFIVNTKKQDERGKFTIIDDSTILINKHLISITQIYKIAAKTDNRRNIGGMIGVMGTLIGFGGIIYYNTQPVISGGGGYFFNMDNSLEIALETLIIETGAALIGIMGIVTANRLKDFELNHDVNIEDIINDSESVYQLKIVSTK
jgi:hypothetical protein